MFRLQVRALLKAFLGSISWSVFQWFYTGGDSCGFQVFPTFGLELYKHRWGIYSAYVLHIFFVVACTISQILVISIQKLPPSLPEKDIFRTFTNGPLYRKITIEHNLKLCSFDLELSFYDYINKEYSLCLVI